ncbi:MAG TPA: hypothetical protein VHM91_16340, partial [Verrucomicrobiales bacterium]|nr:hypothetical protein [Verrucomicrobiales bacterium]
IQHGEVDFRDERRDHTHGRIWRITEKGRPLCPKVNYTKLSVEELVNLLKEPEQWVRLEAKQELKRRKPANLIEVLKAAVEKSDDPHLRIEALWAAETAGSGDASFLLNKSVTNSPQALSAYVRLARQKMVEDGAKAVLGDDVTRKAFGELALHDSARVRLEAVNMFRAAGTGWAVEQACMVLDKPMDENIDFALWLTCRELADTWLPEFQKGTITFGGNVAHIAFALKAADKPEAVGSLLTMVREGKVTGDRVKDVIGLVGSLGKKEDLNKLLAMAAAGPAQAAVIFDALATAAQQRNVKPDGGADQVIAVLKGTDNAAKAAAAKLAGAWKLEGARGTLQEIALNPGPGLQRPVLEGLTALGGKESLGFFNHLLHERMRYVTDYHAEIVAAYAALNLQSAVADAVNTLSDRVAGEKDQTLATAAATRIFEVYLSRKDGPGILAAALKDVKIPAAVASLGMQKASAVGGNTKGLIDALTVSGGLQPVMAMTPEQITQMMADVKANGSPVRGEMIYRRQALLCQTCHAISAVGGIVGPDLVSIGASAPVDYIIESLLEPSKKIKEGYATLMVSTKDGGVHSGFLVREDAREVLLRDATGKTESIPAATVAKKENIPVSLMPMGLTGMLRRDEFVDLVRFLSELGKEGGYKIQEDGTLRRWRTAQPVPDMWRWMNLQGNRGFAQAYDELTWLPLYSHVDGTVPGDEATLIKVGSNEWRAIAAEVDVSAAGKIGLRLNDPAGIQIFVGGKEIPAAAEMQADVPAGKVRVTLLFDTTVRKTPVKVQVYDVPGSPAHAKATGGI